MGSSSSKSINESIIKNKTVNKSTLDILNKSVSNNITNSIIEESKNCSTAAAQTAKMDVGELVISGKSKVTNLNIGIQQKSSVNAACIQETVQKTDLNSQVNKQMSTNILSVLEKATVLDLANSAGASSKTSGLSFGSSSTKTTNKSTNIEETYLDAKKKIEAIVEETVSKNMSNKAVQTCANQAFQTSNLKISKIEIKGGSDARDINIKIDQAVDLLSNCIQKSAQLAKISDEISSILGLTVVDDTKVKTEIKAKNTATAISENMGFGGESSSSSSSISSCVLVVLLLVVAFVLVNQSNNTRDIVTNKDFGDNLTKGADAFTKVRTAGLAGNSSAQQNFEE